jgi:hypothetical protein
VNPTPNSKDSTVPSRTSNAPAARAAHPLRRLSALGAAGVVVAIAAGAFGMSASAHAADTIATVSLGVVQNQGAGRPVTDGYVQCLGLSTTAGDPTTIVGAMQKVSAPNRATFTDVPSGTLYPLQTMAQYDAKSASWNCSTAAMGAVLRGYNHGTKQEWYGYAPRPLDLSMADAQGTATVDTIDKVETLNVAKTCDDGTAACGVSRLFLTTNTHEGELADWTQPQWLSTVQTDGNGAGSTSDLPAGFNMAFYEYLPPSTTTSPVAVTGDVGQSSDEVTLTPEMIAAITTNTHLQPYDVARLAQLEPGGRLAGVAWTRGFGDGYQGRVDFTNPTVPDTPVTPDGPVTPDTPDVPVTPDVPANPTTPRDSVVPAPKPSATAAAPAAALAHTGSDVVLPIVLGAFAVAVGLGVVIVRRRLSGSAG